MKNAERYFIRGNSRIVHKDYTGAIKFFDMGIQSNPKYAWAYLNRGIAKNFSQNDERGLLNDKDVQNLVGLRESTKIGFIIEGDLQQAKVAISDFDNAIRLNPQFAKAYFSRALVKSGFHNSSRLSSGLSNYLDESFTTVRSYPLQSQKLNYWHEDSISVMADFDKAIEIDPEFAEAYYIRGLAKNHSHYHSDTIDDLTKVKEIELNLTGALIMHGLSIDSQLKDFGGAIADFDKAIEINPEFADAYYCRGLVKNHLLNPFAQKISPDHSNAINPDSVKTSEEWDPATEFKSKDYEGIIADFDMAIKINSRHAKAYCSRGLAKIFSQDLCQVRTVLSMNKENGSDLSSFLPRRKSAKNYTLTNYAGTLTDFDSAIQINPRFANAFFLRGIIKVYCHDHAGAKEDFTKAIELDKSFEDVYDNSGFSESLLRPKDRGYLN